MKWFALILLTCIAAAPATQPITAQHFLAQLPPNARPDRTSGWDEFSTVHARDWFAANAAGKQVGLSVTIGGSVTVESPNADHADWLIHVPIAVVQSIVAGVPSNVVVGQGEHGLEFHGDENLARTMKAWKRGTRRALVIDLDRVAFRWAFGRAWYTLTPESYHWGG